MQLMKTTATSAVVFVACLLLSGSAYTQDQARQGYVESVRPFMIEGTKSGTGELVGAALRGATGSTIGKGWGEVAGAILGGLAGAAIKENATRQSVLEITVQLDNGRRVAVTQGADESFYPGDRVLILTYDDVARVTHDY